MRERPTFLPADPPEQPSLMRIAEAREGAERAADSVYQVLDQVDQHRGTSQASTQIRARFGQVLSVWASLAERAQQLRIELAEVNASYDSATAALDALEADFLAFIRAELPSAGSVPAPNDQLPPTAPRQESKEREDTDHA